jgi:hypothetical protein
MTIVKLVCSASCALMLLGALAYGAAMSLRAAVRPAPRTRPPEDDQPAVVAAGTGG